MRPLILLLTLLVPAIHAAGGGPASKTLIRSFDGGRLLSGPGGSSVVARYLFDRTGVPIPHDIAGLDPTQVVQHLVWNGTTVVDTATSPAVLTQVGTVPMVSGAAGSSPWFPAGFDKTGKPGAGPFSASNHYSLPVDSIYDTTGDFVICAVLDGNPVTGATQDIVGDYVTNTSGFDFRFSATGIGTMRFESPAAAGAVSGAAGVNGLNVLCGGRATTTAWVKLNLGTAAAAALPAQVAATTTAGIVGASPSATEPLTMTLRELIFWRGATPTDAVLTAIQQHVFGLYGTLGPVLQPVTFVRATTATCPLPYESQLMWFVPAGVPCINGGSYNTNGTNGGIRVEPARTNTLQQSEASCVAGAVNAPWTLSGTPTCVADQQSGPWAFSSMTMDEWTNATSTHSVFQSSTVASTTTLTGSAWVAKPSGTGTVSLLVQCAATATSACACWTSDGSACTSTVVSNRCDGRFTAVGTTPIRIATLATCSAAVSAAVVLYLVPGNFGSAAGTTRFGGVQMEAGSYVTSYIPTAGAGVARNGDTPSVANPLTSTTPPSWCFGGKYTPELSQAWASAQGNNHLVALNNTGTANSLRVFEATTSTFSMSVFDAATAERTSTLTHPFATGTAHEIVMCAQPPDLRATGDGKNIAGATTGAGTAIIGTQPASIRIGQSGGREFGGYVKNFRICNAGDPARCN